MPEIFNTDQGSQFTSAEFAQPLLARGVKLSMDGRGRALDNVFVERLWRTVKYLGLTPPQPRHWASNLAKAPCVAPVAGGTIFV